jgi:pilus assembly protein CpaF
MEGHGAVTLDDHVRAAQRLLPDCMIVGEIRGAEVVALLKALSMDVGGLCTVHAQSSMGVFSRLVFYAQEGDTSLTPDYVLRGAAESLDLIVHLGRASDGRRVISEVTHVGAFDETTRRPVTSQWFVPGPDGAAVPNPKAPIPADLREVLADHGHQDHVTHPGSMW